MLTMQIADAVTEPIRRELCAKRVSVSHDFRFGAQDEWGVD